jgi:hypothetical protein
MSFHSRLNALREQPETARAGVKWTEEENDQLMKEVMDGIDLEEVAKKHQRTVTGIKSRVMTNALTMMNERDLSLQDVAKLVHISIEDMELHKQRQEQKASAPKAKKTVQKTEEQSNDGIISYQDFMSVLTEIRDYLKIIAEK